MRPRVLPESAHSAYLEFVRQKTREMRRSDQPPSSLNEWNKQRTELRRKLRQAYGEFPESPCDLDVQQFGSVERPGYRIERLMFQTRPGVYMTANAYVPTTPLATANPGRLPAVLSVHGHWAWARVDPTPHARAVGLVKLGYFVLAVDAFGAGERAIVPARGTYHGALLGASTWPVGTPLLGLQIYDNMRAVDYLISRPEVDPDRLAITGASGGGNQSMNSGAWDERLKAVIPVCSVGTYDAYLGIACCVCEALPGALAMAEEGAVLGLIAPRALMVINATKDGVQFSVPEAEKSIARAKPIFELYSAGDRLRHVVVDSGHDYNKPMREAMYGWLAKHLRGEGDGSPITEPDLQIEEVTTLRCFPDGQRPRSFKVMPEFVYEQGRRKLDRIATPDHREWWESESTMIRDRLENRILGGLPKAAPVRVELGTKRVDGEFVEHSVVLYSELNLPIPGLFVRPKSATGPRTTFLIADPDGKDQRLDSEFTRGLLKLGHQVFAIDLRATGETAPKNDAIANVPDHNSCEWGLLMGRPLLGQWVHDILSAFGYLADLADVDWRRTHLVGFGAGGLACLCAAALDAQIGSVAAVHSLTSVVSPEPFEGHRMANFVPFLLDAGDVPHIAAMIAPRKLVLAASVDHRNQPLSEEKLRDQWQFVDRVYGFYGAPERVARTTSSNPDDILQLL